jgi:hypothetical protein
VRVATWHDVRRIVGPRRRRSRRVFATPHFDGYPAILVRLAEIRLPELEELITEAWLAPAPKTLSKEFLNRD